MAARRTEPQSALRQVSLGISVLGIVKASSPQRFFLGVHAADGVARIRLQPFQGTWIRIVIPKRYFERPHKEGFDMAAIGNTSVNSSQGHALEPDDVRDPAIMPIGARMKLRSPA